ncbi:MAG TPA: triose-phosphate isomerase [Gemmatimonadales bacterium]|nr:triose-phosphate isomerase [Gemmatimonadales bacterium]
MKNVPRNLTFAANWKMHHGISEARAFAEKFLALTAPSDGRKLWFFPPAVSIATFAAAVKQRPDIAVGAQNVHWEPKGAYTGGISIPMVVEAGARLTLVGHSERRHLFGETDEQVARKTRAALASGITPLVCVGETLAERDGGRTEQVIVRQLSALLQVLDVQQWRDVVLAYEPVWAIGTGKNATPDDAAQIHELIRMELGRNGVSFYVPILYGGSVNAGNVASLLTRPQLDGVLVGGASLDPAGWADVISRGSEAKVRPSGGFDLVES